MKIGESSSTTLGVVPAPKITVPLMTLSPPATVPASVPLFEEEIKRKKKTMIAKKKLDLNGIQGN